MKKRIVIYIIIFQLILISVISFQVIKRRGVLGATTSVNTISKSDINLIKTDKFSHYYEPKSESMPEEGVTINKDSLNDRFNYQEEKPANTIRIIALGDSWTYGLHVATTKNWTEVFEDSLRRKCKSNIEVINLGVPGYDTAYEVERYKRVGQKYNPDLLVWLFTDMRRITEAVIPEMGYEATKSAWRKTFGPAKMRIIAKFGESDIYEFQKNIAKKIRDIYKKGLVVVSIPELMIANEREVPEQIAQDNSASFYAIRQKIYNSIDLILEDGHPNEKGHQVIASEIEDYILKNNIISCN